MYILILGLHMPVFLSNGLFPHYSRMKLSVHLLFPTCAPHSMTISSSLILSPENFVVKSKSHETPQCAIFFILLLLSSSQVQTRVPSNSVRFQNKSEQGLCKHMAICVLLTRPWSVGYVNRPVPEYYYCSRSRIHRDTNHSH